MNYSEEILEFDFAELKDELHRRIADQHTIDQERPRIAELLNAVVGRR